MRIIIDQIPVGSRYGEIGNALTATMQSARPVAVGEFSLITESGIEITVLPDSDSELGPSLLPYRIIINGSVRAAFDTAGAAVEYATEFVDKLGDSGSITISRSIRAV